jgi:hypothetical protein
MHVAQRRRQTLSGRLLAISAIAGCAGACSTFAPHTSTSPETIAPPAPIYCRAGADCDAKWSRAASWIVTNSRWKIQNQSDTIIQTSASADGSLSPSFTVTKVATAEPSVNQIVFDGGCDNIFRCEPTVAESRAKFAAFVDVPGSTTESSSGQTSNLVWIRTDHRRIHGNSKLEQEDASDSAKCEKEARARVPNDQAAADTAFRVCRERDGYMLVPVDEANQLVR